MATHLRHATTAAHEYRAAQSPQGRHVIAARSGHAVLLSEPELVAEEIMRLFAPGGAARQ
ncbi:MULTISPECIES: hypothetical protein [unclassified Devosia]|uniref:hypothetical protein n=1 Tax=unclassified Devosia TaxID=196773 RepID=UPI001AC37BBE|nr:MULTISPECIES: hypothetical protein [unclassified Devosia]MBN9304788.1 hypothetical protein [Devosia sp.]